MRALPYAMKIGVERTFYACVGGTCRRRNGSCWSAPAATQSPTDGTCGRSHGSRRGVQATLRSSIQRQGWRYFIISTESLLPCPPSFGRRLCARSLHGFPHARKLSGMSVECPTSPRIPRTGQESTWRPESQGSWTKNMSIEQISTGRFLRLLVDLEQARSK